MWQDVFGEPRTQYEEIRDNLNWGYRRRTRREAAAQEAKEKAEEEARKERERKEEKARKKEERRREEERIEAIIEEARVRDRERESERQRERERLREQMNEEERKLDEQKEKERKKELEKKKEEEEERREEQRTEQRQLLEKLELEKAQCVEQLRAAREKYAAEQEQRIKNAASESDIKRAKEEQERLESLQNDRINLLTMKTSAINQNLEDEPRVAVPRITGDWYGLTGQRVGYHHEPGNAHYEKNHPINTSQMTVFERNRLGLDNTRNFIDSKAL